jgi:hypothetical protein
MTCMYVRFVLLGRSCVCVCVSVMHEFGYGALDDRMMFLMFR